MTDIRVGDLIKATRKDDPEVTVTSRVRQVADAFTQIRFQCLYHDHWDIAVIDRPRPALDKDAVFAAAKEAGVIYDFDSPGATFLSAVTAAIQHYVDNTTKENA